MQMHVYTKASMNITTKHENKWWINLIFLQLEKLKKEDEIIEELESLSMG